MSAYFDAAISGLTPKCPVNTPKAPASSSLRPQSGSTSSSTSLQGRVTEKGGAFDSIISAICRLIAWIWPSSVSTQTSSASSPSKLLASFEKPYTHTFEAGSDQEVMQDSQGQPLMRSVFSKKEGQETETTLGRFRQDVLGQGTSYTLSFNDQNVKDSSTVKKAQEDLETLVKQMEKDAIDEMPFTPTKREQLKESENPVQALRDFADSIKDGFNFEQTEEQALAVIDTFPELTEKYREKLKEQIKEQFRQHPPATKMLATKKEQDKQEGIDASRETGLRGLIDFDDQLQQAVQKNTEGQAEQARLEKVLPTAICTALQTWAGYKEGEEIGPVSYADPYYVAQAILSEEIRGINFSQKEIELGASSSAYDVAIKRGTHKVNLHRQNDVPVIKTISEVNVEETGSGEVVKKYRVEEEYTITKGAEGEPCKVAYSRSMTPIAE
ncbi:MAG: hypothetical protein HYZ47_02290 [Simkania negevensis]|nr:hypothetical protein [Simkania negevensis]